jgi:uncharacterized damage-inducible protein DinB
MRMITPEAVLEIHERAHRSLASLLVHCRALSQAEFDREMPQFGDSTVRLQIHHVIGAEKYWLGVLEGRIDADDDAHLWPTIESLESYRAATSAATEHFLQHVTSDELNTPRSMLTWTGVRKVLHPAHILIRTITHIYHHQGQVAVMCRLLGSPCTGLDYSIDA